MKTCLTRLHTEPSTIERTWDVDGVPVLTASLSVPCPSATAGAVSRRIHRFYRLQSRSYLRYCEHWLLPQAKAEYAAALAVSAPLRCFHAELTYCVTYNDGGFWSLYTQSREPLPSGQTLLTRRGDTWDLTAGYPVPLGSFFPRNTRWKRRLLAQATEEIERQLRSGAAVYYPFWRKELRRSFNSRSFYLTGDGLAFFYPMQSLSPSTELPVFVLPYHELRLFPNITPSSADT